MSALEAMASGVPVVASAVGGLKEIITDGETGHLVPEGSEDRLADSILDTLDHDQSGVIERALAFVRQRRSLESYARELNAFLKENQLTTARPSRLRQLLALPPSAGTRRESFAVDFYRHWLQQRQWNIGIVRAPISRFLEPNFRPHVQWFPTLSRDEYFADPFGVVQEGHVRVYCERLNRHAGKGGIGVTEWPEVTIAPRWTPVVDMPQHTSNPFIFTSEGRTYCVPETSRSREGVLFEVPPPPSMWKRVAVLLRDFPGVDNTIIRHDGRWWLFCTGEAAPDRDLLIWYADDLLGPWQAHARNPVKSDVSSSRPGGTPFVWDGSLYRPAQDCSLTYGGRVVINEVQRLTPDEFRERVIAKVEPNRSGPFPLGVHTLSSVGQTTLIDGFRYVHSVLAVKNTLRARSAAGGAATVPFSQ